MSHAGVITSTPGSGDEGFKWYVVTSTTQQAKKNSGYIANNLGTVVITLPTISNPGDAIAVVGINNPTGWKIAQNAGNQIFLNSLATTLGITGFLQSTATYNTVNLICVTQNANWVCLFTEGNLTLT
jgi:hypothetical protein